MSTFESHKLKLNSKLQNLNTYNEKPKGFRICDELISFAKETHSVFTENDESCKTSVRK